MSLESARGPPCAWTVAEGSSSLSSAGGPAPGHSMEHRVFAKTEEKKHSRGRRVMASGGPCGGQRWAAVCLVCRV